MTRDGEGEEKELRTAICTGCHVTWPAGDEGGRCPSCGASLDSDSVKVHTMSIPDVSDLDSKSGITQSARFVYRFMRGSGQGRLSAVVWAFLALLVSVGAWFVGCLRRITP